MKKKKQKKVGGFIHVDVSREVGIGVTVKLDGLGPFEIDRVCDALTQTARKIRYLVVQQVMTGEKKNEIHL